MLNICLTLRYVIRYWRTALRVLNQCIQHWCDWVFVVAAYKDLQSRENTRNAAWQHEGWDEVVYYTGEDNATTNNEGRKNIA